MDFHKFQYLPILKTTDSELRAYNELPPQVQDGILPLFELTKSRRTKNAPEGPVNVRLNKLSEMTQGRPFILDLTLEPTLTNPEIEELLYATSDGYKKWRDFVAKIENVIPIIHYNENADDSDNTLQVKELEKQHQAVAFRIDIYDTQTQHYFKKIVDTLKHPENLIVILDAGYVSVQTWEEATSPLSQRVHELSKILTNTNYFCTSSSFPKTVVAPGYGGDDKGSFELAEVNVHESIKNEPLGIKYGDYGSIHPVRYPIGGGGWIPRIDAPLDRSCFYYRKRPAPKKNKTSFIKDAYIDVAKLVINDKKYKEIKAITAWGDIEIQAAADGSPHGISPSHWIAVRANLHITRQYLRTKA